MRCHLGRGSSSEESEAEEEDAPRGGRKKRVPEWARGRALVGQLITQVAVDPDEVFQQHQKTCSLDEVFGHSGAKTQCLLHCRAGNPYLEHALEYSLKSTAQLGHSNVNHASSQLRSNNFFKQQANSERDVPCRARRN